MTERTYRIIVRGKFDDLADIQKAALRADAVHHDVLSARFTEAGTLTYDPTLLGFTYRFVVSVLAEDSAATADENARAEGELRAMTALEEAGWGYRELSATAMSMDDIKVRPRH